MDWVTTWKVAFSASCLVGFIFQYPKTINYLWQRGTPRFTLVRLGSVGPDLAKLLVPRFAAIPLSNESWHTRGRKCHFSNTWRTLAYKWTRYSVLTAKTKHLYVLESSYLFRCYNIKWGCTYFFTIDLSSAPSMKISRRDLANCMAEHKSILRNNQNTNYSLIFQDRPMFSHINGKLSPRPFEWYGWT